MVEETPALAVRMEATTARFEASLKKAQAALNRSAGEMDKRAGSLNRNLSNVGSDFGKKLTSTRTSSAFRTIGFQMQQMAQTGQVSMATLAGGIAGATAAFGPMGLAAGLAISALAPLASSLFESETAADKLREKINSLGDAFKEYQELKETVMSGEDLTKEFGPLTDNLRALIPVLLEISRQGALTKFRDSLKGTKDELINTVTIFDNMVEQQSRAKLLEMLAGMPEEMATDQQRKDAIETANAYNYLADAYGLTGEAAEKYIEIARQIGPDTTAEEANAILIEMIDMLTQAGGGLENMSDKAREFVERMKESITKLVTAEGRMQDLSAAAVEVAEEVNELLGRLALLPGVIASGSDAMRLLAAEVMNAAQYLRDLSANPLLLKSKTTVGFDLDPSNSKTLGNNTSTKPGKREVVSVRPGGGGTVDALDAAIKAIERQNAALRLEAELVGLSTREKTIAKTRAELLTAAVKDGTAATEAEIAAIEAAAVAAGDAAAALEARLEQEEKIKEAIEASTEAEAERQRMMEDAINGFADAIAGAESFEDALKAVALQAVKVAATAVFSGSKSSNPLGNIFSSLSSIFGFGGPTGGLGAAGGIGKFAKGGPVLAGVPIVTGEEGAELFVPQSPGIIRPAGQTSAMMAGGSGGGRDVQINMPVNIDARGAQLGVDVQIAAALQQFQRDLKPALQQMTARGI